MARPVSTELENALAANPAARDRFWALPPEQKDAWVAFVDRGRLPGARRRRAADATRRLGAAAPVAAETGAAPAAVPALPRENVGEWLVGLALLLGLAAFLLWLTVFRHHHREAKPAPAPLAAHATVPKVTGIAVQSARFQLHDAKLTSRVTHLAAAKPKGIVVAQAPKAGTSVSKGTPVALVVSNGPAGTPLPTLVGLSRGDAVKALKAQGLDPTVREVASKQAPGTVLTQTPKAGTQVKSGTTVVLEVAKGAAATTSVPTVTQTTTTTTTTTTAKTATAPSTGNDYTGMRLSAAVRKIVAGRQQVVVQYVTSASAPAGVVVSNSNAGPRVRLQVSLGAQPKPARDVPDTTSEDAATARQDLEAAGFTVIQASWPVSDSALDGVVVYGTPGGRIAQGAAIVIYIGSATGG